MLKEFILKKLIGSKMKAAGMPADQIDQILKLVELNPEFFQKLKHQVEAKKKQGISEHAATMTVMRENQADLQKLLGTFRK